MNCLKCNYESSKVLDSRKHENHIRRRRECLSCGHRWTTLEAAEEDLIREYADKLNMLKAKVTKFLKQL